MGVISRASSIIGVTCPCVKIHLATCVRQRDFNERARNDSPVSRVIDSYILRIYEDRCRSCTSFVQNSLNGLAKKKKVVFSFSTHNAHRRIQTHKDVRTEKRQILRIDKHLAGRSTMDSGINNHNLIVPRSPQI